MNALANPASPHVAASQPVLQGLSPEMNQILSTLRERHARVQTRLGHAPSEADQEVGRVLLGEIAEIACRARAMLPDPWGLRAGPAVHRAVRAVAVFQRDHGHHPDTAQVARLIETTASDAQCLLRRARLKGWVVAAADRWGRWRLTPDGVRFLGVDSALLSDEMRRWAAE